jgi:hypothetical protein
MELDFEIDKITESIENAETGELLDTLVLPVTKADLEKITKKSLQFDRLRLQIVIRVRIWRNCRF